MPLRSISTTKLLVFNNKVYTHFLPDKINPKVFNQSENEMNSELREPITETNYAPPRPLWYHATLRAEDAAQVLSQRQAGSYLVRKSPTSPDSYRLSVVDTNNVS